MPPTLITVTSNERVFLCGKTGSGKTFAARRLTRDLPRLVVLDPKGSLASWGLEPWDREARRLLRNGEPIRARVVASPDRDSSEIWDEAFSAVMGAGDCTIYVDEVYLVVPPGTRAPASMVAVWTTGRELGIGGFASSQRPAWVPLVVESEAEHFFVFRLTLDEDRRRMASFMGPRVMAPITDPHGLYYMRAEWDAPIYLDELPVNGS